MSVLIVQKTGGGKSLVVLGAMVFLGGVALVVEPLVAVGEDQARSASQSSETSGITTFHLDGLNREDASILADELMQLTSRDDATIILYASPQSLVEGGRWAPVVDHLIEVGVLSLSVVDEAHKVVEDGLHFRTEFAALRKSLFAKLELSPLRVALVVMTATFTGGMLDDFLKMMNIRPFDFTIWGSMSRRELSLQVLVKSQPMTALKNFVKKHLQTVDRKVIIYTNDKSRASKNLPACIDSMVESTEGISGDSLAFTGSSGNILKQYAIAAFASNVPTPCMNLRTIFATDAGECGINSPWVGGVGNDGPPASISKLAQKFGRAGRADGEGFECLVVLSVPNVNFLLVRIEASTSASDRKRQRDDLIAVLRLLLLSDTCIHSTLELEFGDPFKRSLGADAAGERPDPCGNMCRVCRGDLRLQPRVSRDAVVDILTGELLGGPRSSMDLVDALWKYRADVWDSHPVTSKDHAHRVVLQLIAAKILFFKVTKQNPESDCLPSVLLTWFIVNRASTGISAISRGSSGRRTSSTGGASTAPAVPRPHAAHAETARWAGLV
mmetsp:Transcript_34370/g.70251  ORF Transcript_34370/g.70251 Transcript_34370/m.70251 type:complete len:556 (-) Transcript_34370:131-1798(-)